jgi:hypothetical protein
VCTVVYIDAPWITKLSSAHTSQIDPSAAAMTSTK